MKDTGPDAASAPTPGDPLEHGLSDLARLVADCLERVDQEGSAAVDEICAQHPEHAGELRRRLGSLRDVGLLGQGRLGPYELLRTLGQGGMGLVYLARDERLGRLVALKALPSRLTAKPRALERFQREIRTAAQLHHPRIVPIYDVGQVDGVPYFTMEYIEGRTLADVIANLTGLDLPASQLRGSHLAQAAFAAGDERVPLPAGWSESAIETACRLVLDVADGLAAAHEQGVVHRDVKPSNVLVRRDGRAQLFDFGLARLETDESMTLTGDFTGTPFYVSPEQIAGRRRTVDARSDVYSLGVTLYELLTLVRPFTGETAQEVFRQVLGREPPPPGRSNDSIPRDLQTVCLTALEKDRERRYQSVSELADDLRRFLSYRPVKARPIGVAQRVLRRARRNPAASLAITLAAVLVVGAPIGLWMANVAIRDQRDEAQRLELLAEAERGKAVIAAEQASDARAAAEREAERAQASAQLAVEQTRAAEEARGAAEQQRQAAQSSLAKVEAVNSLLMDILAAPAPLQDGRDVTVVEVLDRAAASLGGRLAASADVEVAMRNTLGLTYRALGMTRQASEQIGLAYELV